MDEISEPKNTDEKEPTESADSAELAEIADLSDLEDLDSDYASSPKLKEYLNSSDAPSRYIMILSFLFGFLALSCLTLLVFEYVKYRHNAQKTVEPAVKIVKIEPGFHEELGEFKIEWDDSEMTAVLVAECSTKEVCEQLKNRNVEVRDLLLPVLQNTNRAEVLDPSRKLVLRQQLANKLAELKLEGSVLQIDFSDLTIEAKKK